MCETDKFCKKNLIVIMNGLHLQKEFHVPSNFLLFFGMVRSLWAENNVVVCVR